MSTSTKPSARYETWLAILIMTLVSALAYLPLVNQLGLYKEDWYLIWSGAMRTPQDFLSLYQADRPFAGYIYQLVYPLLGPTPLYWHLLSFLLRLAGVLAFFWLLRMLWPDQKFPTLAAATLFAVYPGYLQQHNAVNKTFWLTSLTFAILSISLTVYALHLKGNLARILVTVLAILLAIYYPLVIEFYIGFEAVRFTMIWYTLQQTERKPFWPGLGRAIKIYLPYLISSAIFLYWRVFVFQSTRPTTNIGRLFSEYTNLPVYMLARIVIETVQDFYETTILAWFVPPYNLISRATYSELALDLFCGSLAMLLVLLYYRWLKQRELSGAGDSQSDNWSQPDSRSAIPPAIRAAIGLGTVTVLVTLLPMVIAGREVNFSPESRLDHYTIQSALGVGMLLVGLIAYALRPNLRLAVIAFLIGIAVMTQVQNGADNARNWQAQRSLWWQLTWRAPQIEKGTLLFVDLAGFGFGEGYEAWAPANFIYAPGSPVPVIAAEVLTDETGFLLQKGAVEQKNHRNIRYDLDYGAPLILSKPGEFSCLNVIDGQLYELSKSDDWPIRSIAPYSRIDRVIPEETFQQPPEIIFGPEPVHDWCYYYQKAMYARQRGDWEAVVRLGDEVTTKGIKPIDRTEWVPFLEGYAMSGQEQQARQLAKLIKSEQAPRREICRQRMEIASPPQNYDRDKIVSILCGES